MPRQARLVLPEVAVHIVQRGNNRAACFACESDRLVYLLHLRELSAKHGCAVHAYCLMTNHVHVLLTPRQPAACAELMRDLGQRYVQYFNRRHARSGTLWEGRFRSCIAESAHYVLACYRYIELNPVRAGLAGDPGGYRWSSFHANAAGREDPLVSPHPEYLALGGQPQARRAAYLGLFEQVLEATLLERIRDATNAGYLLGSDAFRVSVQRALGRKLEPGKPGRPAKAARHDVSATPEIGL